VDTKTDFGERRTVHHRRTERVRRKILGAEEKIIALEEQIYAALVESLLAYIPAIQVNASVIARADCLLSFANAARQNNYIRPEINNSDVIDIKKRPPSGH